MTLASSLRRKKRHDLASLALAAAIFCAGCARPANELSSVSATQSLAQQPAVPGSTEQTATIAVDAVPLLGATEASSAPHAVHLDSLVARINTDLATQAAQPYVIEGPVSDDVRLREDLADSAETVGHPETQDQPTAGTQDSETKVTPPPVMPSRNPCPEVMLPKNAQAFANDWTEAQRAAALSALGACLRKAMAPAGLVRAAMAYKIAFQMSLLDKPMSRMAESELEAFLRQNLLHPARLMGFEDAQKPERSRLRTRFDDRDLDELGRLSRLHLLKLNEAEETFFRAVDSHRVLVEYFAKQSDRYQLLLLLRDGAKKKPLHLAERMHAFLKGRGMPLLPQDLRAMPVGMLRPWTLLAIAPDEGQELASLHPTLENPFTIVMRAVAQGGGTDSILSQQRSAYTKLRALDNPKLPDHTVARADAVRVAVADTGVDFVRYPELGEYLQPAGPHLTGSWDFQDNDPNPYLPAVGLDAHGSGTAASVLTVLSHYAREALDRRQFALSVWKLNTVRSALGSPYPTMGRWANREALPDALIRQIYSPAPLDEKPKIVSISMVFDLQPFLEQSQHEDALLKAPWLWVMAAGNAGISAGSAGDRMPVCLGDVPSNRRIDKHILCVGAVKQGILGDKIAGYSNFGDRVDLYAYESYISLCPNGTSCATPAITGVAAAVAANYPQFTPEQIREVLVRSAEERVLPVDLTTAPADPTLDLTALAGAQSKLETFGGPDELEKFSIDGPASRKRSSHESAAEGGLGLPVRMRTIKFLDPSTMMPKVMEKAKALSLELGGLKGQINAHQEGVSKKAARAIMASGSPSQ